MSNIKENLSSAAEKKLLEVFASQDNDTGFISCSYAEVVSLLDTVREVKPDVSQYETRLEEYKKIYSRAIVKYISDAIGSELRHPGSSPYDLNSLRLAIGGARESGVDISRFEIGFRFAEICYMIATVEKSIERFSEISSGFDDISKSVRIKIEEVQKIDLNEGQRKKLQSLEADLESKKLNYSKRR